MTNDYCGACDNRGWVWDDVAHAAGSTPHKYCICKHGDLLVEEEIAAKRQLQDKFKPCPTCEGTGKVRRDS